MQRNLPRSILDGELASTVRFEKVDAGGVPGEWFRHDDSDRGRVLYYLHGGGYSIGSIDSHRELLCRLCLATGASVLAIDYRLAPEHPFPAQLEDARAVYHWLLGQNYAAGRIVIAGDSAGGGLTMSTLVSLRDRGEPLPAAGVCLSPWVDLEGCGLSFDTNAAYDYLDRRSIRTFASRFVRDEELRNPLAAPIYADLTGLPPLLIQAGGAESLLDDALVLARNARNAGVEVELEVWPDMIHVWQLFANLAPEGQEAIERIGSFIRAHTESAVDRDVLDAPLRSADVGLEAVPRASASSRAGRGDDGR